MTSTIERARELQGELAQLRGALHREPEIGLQLPRTQEKVLSALDGLPLEITTGDGLSSVTAVLRGGRPGGAVSAARRHGRAARAGDHRRGSTPPASTGGCTPAATTCTRPVLVGAARLLCDRRETAPGDVVFMFQPGEEGFDGAGAMIAEGVLDGGGQAARRRLCAACVVRPPAARPRSSAGRGPCSPRRTALHVTVRGAGGHGSAPHHARDPIPAACEMVTALQTTSPARSTSSTRW